MMNSQSNAVPEFPSASQAVAPAAIMATRPMYWSIRRELWEYRSIYAAPLIAAAVFLFGFLIGLARAPRLLLDLAMLNPAQQHEFIQQPYAFASLLIMGTTFIVGVFYCLDALYSERRERSILFWKSLPVSDLTTVLSKASVPLVLLPLISFAITVVLQLSMMLISSAILLANGRTVATLWTQLPLLQMWLMLLYHLVAVHALWYAPIFCWLLLVSGWARRAVFVWALLPPLAICVVEKIAFGTSYCADMLKSRFSGGEAGGDFTTNMAGMDPLSHLAVGRFLSSPGLWIGLAVAAIFLAAAVRLRRYQGPV